LNNVGNADINVVYKNIEDIVTKYKGDFIQAILEDPAKYGGGRNQETTLKEIGKQLKAIGRQQLLDNLLLDAASNNNVGLVKNLLTAGAKVNAVDGFGFTSLHLARSEEVTRLLLDGGAKVNAVD